MFEVAEAYEVMMGALEPTVSAFVCRVCRCSGWGESA